MSRFKSIAGGVPLRGEGPRGHSPEIRGTPGLSTEVAAKSKSDKSFRKKEHQISVPLHKEDAFQLLLH